MGETRVQLPINTPFASVTSTESSDYWGQLSYTAQETKGSLVLVAARTQVVSAFGEQLNTSAG
jgi:hypothetical protein